MEIAFKSALGMSLLGNATTYYEIFRSCSDSLIQRMYLRYVNRNDVKNTLRALLEEERRQKTDYKVQLFKRVYDSLKKRASMSEKCLEKFGKYIPVRIILFDEPYCTLSDNIPLEDYDNNEGEPFWMRPEYILEHYSQTCGNYRYKSKKD